MVKLKTFKNTDKFCQFKIFFYVQRLAETIRLAHQMIPEKNFKDEVQKNCEQRGIVFLPQPNRYREGKQVYKIGKVLAYIDGGSIFVNKNGTDWKPTNLNILLDTADI